MALTSRVKKSVETWESMSVSKSNRSWAADDGTDSFQDVIEDLSMSMSLNTAGTPKNYNGSTSERPSKRQAVSKTAQRRRKRLTVSGVING